MNKVSQTARTGGDHLKRAEHLCNINEGDDAPMMSDKTMKRLIEYLKKIGFSDAEIVKLLEYISGGSG